MAFVYRSSSKQNFTNEIGTPGPGQYLKNKNKQMKYSTAPFNNSSNRQIWQQNPNPGPGSYQVQSSLAHQNKLMEDQAVQMVIFETPKPTSQFKSSTLRFINNKNIQSPGPGQYLTQIVHENKKSNEKIGEKIKTSQLKKYLRESNYHKVRQSEQKQIYIQSRQQPTPLQSQRPTTANILTKKSKNSVFFSSKVKREQRIRPQTSIGPGSYNISSKSKEKVTKVNKAATKSICIQKYSSTNGPSQFIKVGPGSYEVQKSFKFIQKPKIIQSKHLQCFGSTVDRFTSTKSTKQNSAPGPASYQTIKYNHKEISKSKGKRKTTFGTDQKRQFFTIKSNPNLAPGAYQTYNDFENLLKQKFKNGTIGNFGSTQQRFCQKPRQSVVDKTKIQNIELLKASSRQNCEDKVCGKFKRLGFKSKFKKYTNNLSVNITKEMHMFSKIDPRPLCYDAQTYTLSKKFKTRKQIDAPFLTCSQRFNFQDSKPQLNLEEEINKKQGSVCSSQRKNSKSKSFNKSKGCVSMKFTDCRFKYPQEKQTELGPQYYNAHEYQKIFAKKSFNKLFS